MYETTENTWRERDSVFTSSMTNRALSIPSIVFFFLFHMLVRIVLSTSPFKTGVTKRSEKSGNAARNYAKCEDESVSEISLLFPNIASRPN